MDNLPVNQIFIKHPQWAKEVAKALKKKLRHLRHSPCHNGNDNLVEPRKILMKL